MLGRQCAHRNFTTLCLIEPHAVTHRSATAENRCAASALRAQGLRWQLTCTWSGLLCHFARVATLASSPSSPMALICLITSEDTNVQRYPHGIYVPSSPSVLSHIAEIVSAQ